MKKISTLHVILGLILTMLIAYIITMFVVINAVTPDDDIWKTHRKERVLCYKQYDRDIPCYTYRWVPKDKPKEMVADSFVIIGDSVKYFFSTKQSKK